MENISLLLQVPKYLKNILTVKFGESYFLKPSDLFGFAVLNALKKKSESKYEYRHKDLTDGYRFRHITEYYCIYISVKLAQRNGFVFCQKRAFQLVRALDRQIREELYHQAVVNKNLYEIDYQTTLLNFLDHYDIEEESLSYESLRKDFNRFKRKIEENIKRID